MTNNYYTDIIRVAAVVFSDGNINNIDDTVRILKIMQLGVTNTVNDLFISYHNINNDNKTLW